MERTRLARGEMPRLILGCLQQSYPTGLTAQQVADKLERDTVNVTVVLIKLLRSGDVTRDTHAGKAHVWMAVLPL